MNIFTRKHKIRYVIHQDSGKEWGFDAANYIGHARIGNMVRIMLRDAKTDLDVNFQDEEAAKSFGARLTNLIQIEQ